MNSEKDIARRIVELDEALDNIIAFRAERLADELHEFRARNEDEGSALGTAAKVGGAGLGLAGAAGAAKIAYDSRANKFDNAPGVKNNPNMARMNENWKKKGLGQRMRSTMGNIAGGGGAAKGGGVVGKSLQYGSKGALKVGGALGAAGKFAKKLFTRT